MKRLIALMVLMTYMASAIGFTFSFHYCGGHYKGICFTSDTERGCCGKNEHKTNCCEDKVIKAKFKDDHSSSVKATLGKVAFEKAALLHTYLVPLKIQDVGGYPEFVSNDPSPPHLNNVPIYLMNCVLRV